MEVTKSAWCTYTHTDGNVTRTHGPSLLETQTAPEGATPLVYDNSADSRMWHPPEGEIRQSRLSLSVARTTSGNCLLMVCFVSADKTTEMEMLLGKNSTFLHHLRPKGAVTDPTRPGFLSSQYDLKQVHWIRNAYVCSQTRCLIPATRRTSHRLARPLILHHMESRTH